VTQVWRDWGSVVVVSILGLPLAALITVALARWRRSQRVPARVAWWHSAAEVGMVAGTLPWVWMILTPRSAPRQVWLVPLSDLANQLITTSPAQMVIQAGGNLLVFAGLGFFAPVRFAALARPVRLLALGAAGSALVETLQYVLDLGRVSSVDDVLINAVGAALAGLASRPWWAIRSGGAGQIRARVTNVSGSPFGPAP
jgi:hypothetical protein